MTPRAFCQTGESELIKGGFHCAAGFLTAVMATYNIAAWLYRRESHLAVNGVVYTFATLWEARKTIHHWSAVDDDVSLSALR